MRTNFDMQYQNITMVKGDTLSFNVQIFNENGQPLTVDSAFLTCKKDPAGDEYVFQKSLNAGILQENGLLTVRVSPEDTENADAGQYRYQMRIGVDGDNFTLMIGTLTLEQNITN